VARIFSTSTLGSFFNQSSYSYPVPGSINYFWNFGFYSGICLTIQFLTGFLLAMYYVPTVEGAFLSVEHIMRDINYGWLIRYFHANGASFFFIAVYVHIARGLYFGSYSYPRTPVWIAGVAILLNMIAVAFLGYVLPWGQMSLWGATVITNLFSAIPFLGESVVVLLWGGYTIGTPTLGHFFSLHFGLSFLLLGLTFLHLFLLHLYGSNNPLGLEASFDTKPIYPYFFLKDLFGLVFFISFFSGMVFFYPNFLGHPDNYTPANPMVTPAHIVPEWYFLPFYAILRAVPDKLFGVLALASSILILALVPFLDDTTVRSNFFKPLRKFLFWFFVFNFIFLGWLGGQPVKQPFLDYSQGAALFHFCYFLFLIPIFNFFEGLMFLNLALSTDQTRNG
jgi:ubiquinol-cytochrome c reductase cytochrome b/c1 subunit